MRRYLQGIDRHNGLESSGSLGDRGRFERFELSSALDSKTIFVRLVNFCNSRFLTDVVRP